MRGSAGDLLAAIRDLDAVDHLMLALLVFLALERLAFYIWCCCCRSSSYKVKRNESLL